MRTLNRPSHSQVIFRSLQQVEVKAVRRQDSSGWTVTKAKTICPGQMTDSTISHGLPRSTTSLDHLNTSSDRRRYKMMCMVVLANTSREFHRHRAMHMAVPACTPQLLSTSSNRKGRILPRQHLQQKLRKGSPIRVERSIQRGLIATINRAHRCNKADQVNQGCCRSLTASLWTRTTTSRARRTTKVARDLPKK